MSYLLEFKDITKLGFKIPTGRCNFLLHRISDEPLIVNKWVQGRFVIKGKNLRIFIDDNVSLPNDYYEIRALAFYDANNKLFHAMTNPIDFTAPYFQINENVIIGIEKEEVEESLKDWEKTVAIGEPDESSEIKYREVHLICSDTLITVPSRIGPAEIYPLSRYGLVDLANSITEMLLHQGIRYSDLGETINFLNSQGDRRSPIFSMSFYRIYQSKENIFETLFQYIQTIFGILTVNRGGYPKYLGGVYVENRRDGKRIVSPFNLNSYYRGNLVGGFISKEIPSKWNEQYHTIIDSEFIREIVAKLNSAHDELDLDYAYLKFWGLLEAIAYYFYMDKHLERVKQIIELAYTPQKAEKEIKLPIGDLTFTFDELLTMWLNRRGLTTHNGGISSSFSGLTKAIGNNNLFIKEMQQLNKPLMYGEDDCLILLKEVCTKVVEKFINNEIIVDEN